MNQKARNIIGCIQFSELNYNGETDKYEAVSNVMYGHGMEKEAFIIKHDIKEGVNLKTDTEAEDWCDWYDPISIYNLSTGKFIYERKC